jgi:hypothetical protein
MATLASTAVAYYPSDGRANFHVRGDSTLVSRSLLLTLTGQGGRTNTITASALGFSTLRSVSTLWDDTNAKGYPAVIDPVTNTVVLLDGSAAPAPVDVTSSAAYITVVGDPKPATSVS